MNFQISYENSESHIQGEFVKIREFTLDIIFVNFRNDDFGLKWDFWNFSELSLSI